jgi:phosphatidylcholine synthase
VPPTARVLAAWFVHLYTASGAVLAFFAATEIFAYRYRSAFLWLALQIVVDATDGFLARRLNVGKHAPLLRGAHLDDIVDYVSYVFVPALFIWRSLIVPRSWELVVCGAVLLSSAFGFSRADAKTADRLFTGFPSYWNIVVFYLLLAGFSPELNGALLLALSALVLVPMRFVYPSQTPQLKFVTLTLGVVWAVVMLWMVWRMPDVPRLVLWGSMVFPIYYFALSLWITVRRGRTPGGGVI